MNDTLLALDQQHIWHPASQMKDYADLPPLLIRRAQGAYLELDDGRQVLDAISSWWCKSLGHGHPRLKAALLRQLGEFEHVIFAGTTYSTVIQLAQKLASLTPNLDKVFFASDGACAVEIAVKMSLHGHQIRGHTKRTRFMALENGYHGETILTGALTDDPLLRKQYGALMPDVAFIHSIPYVDSREDPLWQNCAESWPSIVEQLDAQADTLAGIICEPIVQGAAGMRIYSQDFLKRLRVWTKANGVDLIADEIMTGIGRTGYPLACQHAKVEPDFVCLSKGLTAGFLPMSVVLTSTALYRLFYDDYKAGKSFLHSHTYSGHALSAAVALECLTVMEEEHLYAYVQSNQSVLLSFMQEVADKTKRLHAVRCLGGIVAADLRLQDSQKNERIGYEVYKKGLEKGILLRPLGNTVYWLPPLNISPSDLCQLRDKTIAAIQDVDSMLL